MSSDFKEQVVWITGASSGIGAAMARAFAEEGARVILSARRHEALLDLAHTLPGEPLVLPLDVSDEAAIPPAVAQALAWQGHVDVLINNAGVSQRARIQETDIRTGRRVMDVNFFGAAALTAALLPAMLARGQGHIVNMTSVAAYVAAPLRAFYSASKHALRAWSNTLRAELSGSGVHVTMICPGFVSTKISQHALGGDGEPLMQLDPQVAQGFTPEEAAARILPAVARRRRELYLGRVEILAIYLQRFTPWLVAFVLPDRLPWADSSRLTWIARTALRAVWGLSAPPRPTHGKAQAKGSP
ncbi:MAG: SDR family oxidoreductase [Alphaproteobacteria bacterium]|nr:SDR family oxidoreductase [Alphaproteobacteria bacterium]